MAAALPWGLLLAAALTDAPQQRVLLRGSIADQQGRPIAGASVALSCPVASARTASDTQGRFSIESESLERCSVTVTHSGFETEVRPATPAPLVFVLRVAAVIERVTILAPARPVLPGLAAASADLDATQLRIAGPASSDWVRYARRVAGDDRADGVVSVDGLETTSLPAPMTIARIQVNADPFSVEFAEPGVARVEISTRGPSREFTWSFGGAALGAGGGNPLHSNANASSDGLTLGFSGGLPRLPVTLVATGDVSRESATHAVQTPADPYGSAVTESHAARVSLSLFSSAANIEWRARYSGTHSHTSGDGVGGISSSETGHSETDGRHELHLTFTRRAPASGLRGGLALTSAARARTPNHAGPHLFVPGVLAGGASGAAAESIRKRTLTAKLVADRQLRGRPFLTGVTLTVAQHNVITEPNPHGTRVLPDWDTYEKASEHTAGAGTLFVRQGDGVAALTNLQASAFLESVVLRSGRGALRAGLRADHQTHDSPRLSPRLSGSWHAAGFTFAGAAGIFTHNTPPELLTRILVNDEAHLREVILPEAAVVVSALDGAFRRRSDLVVRGSAGRQLAAFRGRLEYTFTRGRYAAGTVRHPTAAGWQDTMTSAFGVARHQLHFSAGWRRGDQSITGHVEAISAKDQSGGAMSIQSPADALAGGWARSASIPSLRSTVAGAFVLPAAVSVSVMATMSTGAPYDVTTGRLASDYSLTDRGGRDRNSGRTLPVHTVDVHGLREFSPSGLLRRTLGPRVSLGVRVENLFNRTNVLALGDVAGTRLYGRPLDAAPSRSFRVWLAF